MSVINSAHCEQASGACLQSKTGAMEGKPGNKASVPVTQPEPALFYHPEPGTL